MVLDVGLQIYHVPREVLDSVRVYENNRMIIEKINTSQVIFRAYQLKLVC